MDKCGLLIILGSPAGGKTTLARRLAEAFGIPCLCKDDVKEALFDALGTGDREWSRRLSRASFAALARLAEAQMAAGLSCIVEGNFRREHAAALAGVLVRRGGSSIQVRCLAEPEELRRRFEGRQRHPGHLDQALIEELEVDPGPFLDLPGMRLDYWSGRPGAEAQLIGRLRDIRIQQGPTPQR
jgi:predicted kinase